MKNTKEIKPILTAIFCINRTNGYEDTDITELLKYLFLRCMNGNVNMLMLACVGKTKEQIMPEISELLTQETQFNKYKEGKN